MGLVENLRKALAANNPALVSRRIALEEVIKCLTGGWQGMGLVAVWSQPIRGPGATEWPRMEISGQVLRATITQAKDCLAHPGACWAGH
jgi:hypothetical protein